MKKKKPANPESKWGPKELEGGDIDWTTPNFDIHIQNPEPGDLDQEYTVTVFDSRIKNNDDAFVDSQGFWFWWEVLEYLEGWN